MHHRGKAIEYEHAVNSLGEEKHSLSEAKARIK
jgi:hypothetical protein